MRCLDCHYSLENLTENRCPECGRAFDPNDTSTFGRRIPCEMGVLKSAVTGAALLRPRDCFRPKRLSSQFFLQPSRLFSSHRFWQSCRSIV